MSARYLAVASAAALLVAGCSAGSTANSGTDPRLQADVLALTQAAATRNWTAADAALSRLRGDLASAVSAGAISAARAGAISRHVAAVAADITARTSTPAAPSTTAPSTRAPAPKPTPKPQPPKRHDKHRHGGGGDQGGDGGD